MTFVLYSNHSWYLCSVFLSQQLLTFLFLLQTKPWPRPQQLHLWRPPRLLSNALKQWHPAGTPKQTKTLIQTPSLSPTEGRISSDAVTSSWRHHPFPLLPPSQALVSMLSLWTWCCRFSLVPVIYTRVHALFSCLSGYSATRGHMTMWQVAKLCHVIRSPSWLPCNFSLCSFDCFIYCIRFGFTFEYVLYTCIIYVYSSKTDIFWFL